MNQETPERILLIEPDPGLARGLYDMLQPVSGPVVQVTHARSLSELKGAAPADLSCDLVILELGGEDPSTEGRFEKVARILGDKPVLLLAGPERESEALAAIAAGAQDYVDPDNVTPEILRGAVGKAMARHRRRKQLVDSNTRFQMAAEMAMLGEWEVYLDPFLIRWSEEVKRIHEVPEEQDFDLGEAIDFYVPEHRGEVKTLFDRCAGNGEPFSGEWDMITGRKRRIRVKVRARAVRDGAGKIVKVHGTLQDVTETYQNFEGLRLLRESVRHLNVGVMICDASEVKPPGPRIVFVNDAFTRLTEYDADEVIGKSPRILQGERTSRDTLDRIRTALRREESIRCELENYTKSGKPYWIELEMGPIRDGSGRVTHYVSVQRDITERKEMETALNRSLQEQLELQDALNRHAIVSITDPSGNITFANDKFRRIFGFEEEVPDGVTHSELGASAAPPRSLDDSQPTTPAGASVWQGEVRYFRPGGLTFWADTTVFPFLDENETPTRYLYLQSDITDRKAAEEKLVFQASLLDRAHDAIYVKTLEGVISYWNRAAEDLFGWSAGEAVSSLDRSLLRCPDQDYDRASRKLLGDGQWNGELALKSRTGQMVSCDASWTLVNDSAGKPEAVLAILTDISEKKDLEGQVLRSQRIESVGRLAGGIAHDLNNMLSPILMSVDSLRGDEDEEARTEILDILESSAERAGNLVRQVLTFSRGMDGDRVPVDVRGVMDDVAAIVRETFPRDIRVSFHCDKHLPLITSDPTQLHQVLMNLCVNARDAMESGGELSVVAEPWTIDEVYSEMNPDVEPGPFVRISVRDTGHGIPKELREKIFDPFFTTKEVGEGSGIGLSTCLGIVRSHHGIIELESESSRGSEFRLYFPANLEATSTEAAKVSLEDLPRGNGELILVVDDEISIRTVSRKTLERHGYRTVTAENGAEAVAVYARRQEEIDLVLTDLAMPVMSGESLIIALQAMNPNVLVIASSGHESRMVGNGEEGASGICNFIPKPHTAATLLRGVADALAGQNKDAPPELVPS